MILQDNLKGTCKILLKILHKILLLGKEGLCLLSEPFNQDPLESFFGQQRARGGRCDNPNVRNFLCNTQAIRVQRTLAIGDGGNVQKRSAQWTSDDLSRPLKKRQRTLFHDK